MGKRSKSLRRKAKRQNFLFWKKKDAGGIVVTRSNGERGGSRGGTWYYLVLVKREEGTVDGERDRPCANLKERYRTGKNESKQLG